MANDVNRKLVGNNGSFSYDSVGNAEDLHDILININPTRTKFLSKFGTAEKAVSTDFSWFTERLRPPQDNAHLEKEDYTFSEIGTQEGLRNFIQHFQNSGFITDTQNSIKKAFRRGTSEFNAAVDHAIRGQGEDIELMIVKSKVGNLETPGTKAARSGGIPFFLQANTVDATVETTGGVVTLTGINAESNPIDLSTGDFVYFTATKMPTGLEANRIYYIRIEDSAKKDKNKFKLYYDLEEAVDGTATNIKPTDAGTGLKMVRRNVVSLGGAKDFTLEDINTVLEMIYRRGGNANQAYMSLRNKRKFSKLVNAQSTAYRPADTETKLNDAATVYESDFGVITASAHAMYPDSRLDILDMQYWDLKWLNNTHEVSNLAKTGTYEKFVVESDLGVQATAPQASGAIVDIKR